MGSERRFRLVAAVPVALALMAAAPATPPPGGPSPTPPTSPTAAPSEPWWVPVGLRGEAVTAVVPGPAGVLAVTRSGERCLRPPGSGGTPACAPGHPSAAAGPSPPWSIRDGRVYREDPGRHPVLDPHSPDLGGSARLLAAPAALPGVVLAVAADGVVWRRDASGSWARALLLLPQNLVAGPPPVTGLAAFATAPLTPAVYLATDGYAVLISDDGGDDWFRAAPGLPSGVLALATEATTRAVYAGTRDGLWVHHLQALPAPPVYRPSGLLTRWLQIAVMAVVVTALGVVALAAGAGRFGRTPPG